jgi:hypothetical protein
MNGVSGICTQKPIVSFFKARRGSMWTRITTSEQLKSIGVGTLLIKALSGSKERLDVDDKDRLSVRYVMKNFPTFEEFDLSLIPYQMEHFVYMLSGLRNLSFASMHKRYDDLIQDGNYWIYNNRES